MIAKKEWFKPRVAGWGLRPTTWEGWLYVLIAILLFFGALNLPLPDLPRIIIAGAVMALFLVDSMIVMFEMYKKLDERERKHQQIIETAASYTAVVGLIVALLYRAFVQNYLDNWIIGVLIAMVVVKAGVSLHLMKNG